MPAMPKTNAATISVDHVLAGTWITDEEDSNVAFTFSSEKNGFRVSGFCRSDGEEFKISKVKWDGKADLELTTSEVWKKKDVKRGEIAEAWQVPSVPAPSRAKVRRSPGRDYPSALPLQVA